MPATAVIRSSAGFANAAISTTIAVPAQNCAIGDLIGIYVDSVAAGLTLTDTGDGFTAQTPASGQNGSSCLLSRTATSADVALFGGSGSYTVTCSVSHAMSGAIFVIEGPAVVTDPAFSGSGAIAAGTGTTITAPSITTTVNGDLLIWFGFNRVASGAPLTMTQPAGYTTVVAQTNATTGSANTGTMMATAVQSTAGATGTVVGSMATNTNGGGLLIGFAPIIPPPALVIRQAVNRAATY